MPDADAASRPSPADRAVRVIADAAGESRPRRPHDGSDPAVPVAATVVIVRDRAGTPEVLMIERPDRGSFAGAWVFPGGKLEPGDVGSSDPPDDESQAARRAAVRETIEEIGLHLPADTLQPLSVWDPPPGIALRIRTWFFLAPDPGGALTPAPDEVVATAWIRPADMLDRHARGEVTLYPPTWVTLHELAEQHDTAGLFGVARLGGPRRYDTVARQGTDGPMLLWPGDAEYDGAATSTGAASRHRLHLATLPWVYLRTD